MRGRSTVSRAAAESFFLRCWYQGYWPYRLLLPLTLLYTLVVWCRRRLYLWRILSPGSAGVPVVVVGNLSVGGTGKTPLTIWLASELRRRGVRVGIVSRGYGGTRLREPALVDAAADPAQVGDEAPLMAGAARVPVCVHHDRLRAARTLAAQGVELVISDDGLQHLRLGRQLEIVVVDASRKWGNGWCLPAGPLREPLSRLNSIDRIVVNGPEAPSGCPPGVARMWLEPVAIRPLGRDDGLPLTAFAGRRVHAVAGIGNPQRFFDTLRRMGTDVIGHPRPDHWRIAAGDLRFADGLPVLITEKDAVKCAHLNVPGVYVVTVSCRLGGGAALAEELEALIARRRVKQ